MLRFNNSGKRDTVKKFKTNTNYILIPKNKIKTLTYFDDSGTEQVLYNNGNLLIDISLDNIDAFIDKKINIFMQNENNVVQNANDIITRYSEKGNGLNDFLHNLVYNNLTIIFEVLNLLQDITPNDVVKIIKKFEKNNVSSAILEYFIRAYGESLTYDATTERTNIIQDLSKLLDYNFANDVILINENRDPNIHDIIDNIIKNIDDTEDNNIFLFKCLYYSTAATSRIHLGEMLYNEQKNNSVTTIYDSLTKTKLSFDKHQIINTYNEIIFNVCNKYKKSKCDYLHEKLIFERSDITQNEKIKNILSYYNAYHNIYYVKNIDISNHDDIREFILTKDFISLLDLNDLFPPCTYYLSKIININCINKNIVLYGYRRLLFKNEPDILIRQWNNIIKPLKLNTAFSNDEINTIIYNLEFAPVRKDVLHNHSPFKFRIDSQSLIYMNLIYDAISYIITNNSVYKYNNDEEDKYCNVEALFKVLSKGLNIIFNMLNNEQKPISKYDQYLQMTYTRGLFVRYGQNNWTNKDLLFAILKIIDNCKIESDVVEKTVFDIILKYLDIDDINMEKYMSLSYNTRIKIFKKLIN